MIVKNDINDKLRKNALDIINSGLEGVKTEKIIREKIKLKNNVLVIKNYKNKIIKIGLKKFNKIIVIGFGKASSFMAKELEGIIGSRISNGIIVSTQKIKLKKIKVRKGTHPMPSLRNVEATREIVDLLKKLSEDDLVICLVSGGGSALLCCPSINFKNYLKIIDKNYKSGIDIKKLNQIRKKLSLVKGGKLAKLTKAKIVSLIFSDVVGDDLSTIASGPTVGKNLKNVKNILLLNNLVALEAMKKKAKQLGYKPVIYSSKLRGEARLVGKKLLKVLKNKDCLLFGGETTVKVKGKGKGGRNQELCLGAIEELSKVKNACMVSVGSDGIDGVCNAAGAIIDCESSKKAKKLDLDCKKYLENNDSYNFFKKMDCLVVTGATGSNVADLGVIIKEKR
jgi:hydroxypyruvate reductase/glycerate 2-kinase